MNCANHPNLAATAYCRTCGKPLCSNCTRDVRGVIYCESCIAARLEGAPIATPQPTVYQQVMDQGAGLKVPPSPGPGPHPVLAGLLGAIPFGIGAVYNGQYAKGLAHLMIFVVLVFGANHANGGIEDMFGFGIAFFVIYQIIDAVKTAQAIQAGLPAPDPMGLGEMFGQSQKFEAKRVPSGAIVLIALGVLFLFTTIGDFAWGWRLWPLLLIFLGGWMLAKQRDRSRLTGPIMVLTTGLIFFLWVNTERLSIGKTWPAWILAAGVGQLLRGKPGENLVSNDPMPPPGAPPVAPVAGDSSTSSSSSSSEVHHG